MPRVNLFAATIQSDGLPPRYALRVDFDARRTLLLESLNTALERLGTVPKDSDILSAIARAQQLRALVERWASKGCSRTRRLASWRCTLQSGVDASRVARHIDVVRSTTRKMKSCRPTSIREDGGDCRCHELGSPRRSRWRRSPFQSVFILPKIAEALFKETP